MQKYYHLALTVATFSNSSLLKRTNRKKVGFYIMLWPFWKPVVLVFYFLEKPKIN